MSRFCTRPRNAAISLEVTVTAAEVGDAADIERILTGFAREPNGGVIVTPSPVTNAKDKRELIVALADRLSLPAIYPSRLSATSGELISYVYDTVAQWQGAATYVDRILRGAKPSELPVQAPTKYEMIVNLKTAKALGLTIPESFLLRADKVIE
jgi:putative tryptophan/tyrosine transport system substrate-binding protein